ncbi:MAG: response regulator [Calditrichaeota bacterium]|nr:response regulator [Calditrichota bacterium]
MKILIVDDSITMRRIISNILKSAGYEDVVHAGDGNEALTKLKDIELILTDWNMPGMDGLAFVKEVRKKSDLAKVPILMVTTEGTKDAVIDALKAGVNDYIVKPFTKSTLMEKLESILK